MDLPVLVKYKEHIDAKTAERFTLRSSKLEPFGYCKRDVKDDMCDMSLNEVVEYWELAQQMIVEEKQRFREKRGPCDRTRVYYFSDSACYFQLKHIASIITREIFSRLRLVCGKDRYGLTPKKYRHKLKLVDNSLILNIVISTSYDDFDRLAFTMKAVRWAKKGEERFYPIGLETIPQLLKAIRRTAYPLEFVVFVTRRISAMYA